MNKKAIFIFFLCFLSLLAISNLNADQRIDNIEFYLVLDKSLSMVEEIESVKKYVLDNIVNRIVTVGDFFYLIPFYGRTDKSFNGIISSNEDINSLGNSISALQADGRFTDIGNALNILRLNINNESEFTRKYMLLITDGKQEAPPESKYYSPDGSFNHEFLANTKEIQKQGWKIIILGIGTESIAKDLAKELSAGYSVIEDNVSTNEIEQKLDTLLGLVEITSFNKTLTQDNLGQTSLNLELINTGYENLQTINIAEVQLLREGYKTENILKNIFSLEIIPNETSEISIPVVFPITEEEYTAELVFVFEGENIFTPSRHDITVNNQTAFKTYFIYFAIGVILIIIIIISLKIYHRKKLEDENNSNARV
jgi:hypothetical protein